MMTIGTIVAPISAGLPFKTCRRDITNSILKRPMGRENGMPFPMELQSKFSHIGGQHGGLLGCICCYLRVLFHMEYDVINAI